NLMIDVPCLALDLAAVAWFLRARDHGSWSGGISAGILAGLAMQTKYTALTAPLVLLTAAGLGPPARRQRSVALGIAAAAISVTVLASWELFTAWRYGQSHFLYHLSHHGTPWIKKFNFF